MCHITRNSDTVNGNLDCSTILPWFAEHWCFVKPLQVIDQVVSMDNFIKMRPMKRRIFRQLCSSMDADYECLLLHTEARWLSRGKVLNRVLQLRNELLFFSKQKNTKLLVNICKMIIGGII